MGTPIKRAGKKIKKTATANVISPVLRGGMPRTLGVRITALSPKKVVGEMPIKPMHVNFNGNVNGGAIMAFGDVLGAAGAVENRPLGYRGGTIESKTNFFVSGKGPVLLGVAIPLHIGRTTSVWQTTVRNSDKRVVAIVTQTQIAIPGRPEAAPGLGKKRAAIRK